MNSKIQQDAPFFSIIIPIYQAEKFLEECINSILNQSFSNWELILVNDGSKDNSLAICTNYAKHDERIVVLSQDNSGAAVTRNTGTNHARGKYILYVDSDDYLDSEDALKKIYDKLKQTSSDICLFGCYDYYEKENIKHQSRGNYNQTAFDSGDKQTILTSLMVSKEFPGSCWIMAVSKKLITEHHISFIPGHKAEDIDWILHVLSESQTFSAINDAIYIYRKAQDNSVTGTAGLQSILDIIKTLNVWTVRLKELGPECSPLKAYVVYIFFTTFVIYNTLEKQDREIANNCYNNIQIDFSGALGFKEKALSTFYRIFGYKITSLVVRIIK